MQFDIRASKTRRRFCMFGRSDKGFKTSRSLKRKAKGGARNKERKITVTWEPSSEVFNRASIPTTLAWCTGHLRRTTVYWWQLLCMLFRLYWLITIPIIILLMRARAVLSNSWLALLHKSESQKQSPSSQASCIIVDGAMWTEVEIKFALVVRPVWSVCTSINVAIAIWRQHKNVCHWI